MNKNKLKDLLKETHKITGKGKKDLAYKVESAFVKTLAEGIIEAFNENEKNLNEDFSKYKTQVKNELIQLVKEEASKLDKSFKELDETLAQGLPQLDKKHIDLIEHRISELKKGIDTTFSEKDTDMKESNKSIEQLKKNIEDQVGFIERAIKNAKEDIGLDLDKIQNGLESKISERVSKEELLKVEKIVKDILKDIEKLNKGLYEFSSALQVSSNGVYVGNATLINFKSGTNTTVSVSQNGTGLDVKYNSTGGGSSGFQQPLSGAVNGINQTYTWATAPNVLSVDNGRVIQKVSSDGTINWTGTTTTVLSIAPNNDICAIA